LEEESVVKEYLTTVFAETFMTAKRGHTNPVTISGIFFE